MTTNKMISKVEDHVLVLERVFDAPRELVFKAFSEAEHLKRWFGPKGWPLTVCNIDFRPGGVWHFCMKCTDESQEYYGQESWGKAVYHEIVEPERIVYVDSFSDAEGNIVEGMPETLVTMTFVEHEGKTKLISHAQYASADALKTVMDMGMLEGIASTWDNLEEFLEEIK
ncbi:SRPBCC domain-containing protein [Paenibacillus validus]|uniref:SRPBCC domain-containing protein n=2 Tax=Paenibacillus TaxID=44249 RepID=A0A7X3CTY0_9BACL|nr:MULTISPECIES: SRPBCC domain-containing protein [Paenibacillus]MED4601387.1 SRPBCC domain-containing protein [Paenibacillus validus]MED4605068.1 SRPBCC domain-containing protein [Paenibacillus validus]MUG72922.1 SRPBCC domain-containing protein [Paenibacillus validus]